MITIGTAGHIDHGKSAIVHRVTGTDPDRLPEEKARGMTIDLGFAFYKTAAGETIGLVDVPGHERFVKNMIAGAGGIDAVMLVVAADDGWMPQSEEHFQITRLLGIQHGWVVINKCDLAEPDWLNLLESDIRDKLAGTFLESRPILRLSAETGQGFDSLKALLDDLPEEIRSRDETGKARLFIDRSFVQQGIGGVVTGTLRGGRLSVGQAVSVWPSKSIGKIRTLHSQGEEVASVNSGQRTAMSLTGVDKELMIRGGVIAERLDLSFFEENPVLALQVELTPNASLPITDRRRILIIVGTTEAEGELRLFNRDEIGPSQSGLAFFKPDQPIHALVGDHFIVRLPTPMITLGGGIIVDHLAKFPRRKELQRLSYLEQRTSGEPTDLLISELLKHCTMDAKSLLESSVVTKQIIEKILRHLLENGEVMERNGQLYLPNMLASESTLLFERMNSYLLENSHLSQISVDNVMSLSSWSENTTSVILELLVADGRIVRQSDSVTIVGMDVSLSGPVKDAYDRLMQRLKADKYAPPTLGELASGGKVFQQAIKFLIDSGEAHKCGSDFIFLQPIWSEIVEYIKDVVRTDGALKPAHLRERFGLSRKYVIPILEETDRSQLTRRDGDVRRKGERFNLENPVS